MPAKMVKTKTPGIYKRGSRYVVVWEHKGTQRKQAFRTYAEAREAKGQKDSGERTPASRAKFEEYANAWLETYSGRTNRGLSETTRSDYKRSLKAYVIPFFKSYRLSEIEPGDVRKFVAYLEKKKLAPTSVKKNLAPLRALLATAVEDNILRWNPTTSIRVNGRQDDDEEVRAKRLKSKSGRRDLPLSPLMARKLWVLRGRTKHRSNEHPVFPSNRGTYRLEGNLRRDVLTPAAKAAGLEWVSFHTFRHTCASLLFAAGKNVKQVQEWLGHADPAFTLRTYIHLMDEGLGEAD